MSEVMYYKCIKCGKYFLFPKDSFRFITIMCSKCFIKEQREAYIRMGVDKKLGTIYWD